MFKRGEQWQEAVKTARAEYAAKGIENPDDKTRGYLERINELMNGAGVKKSFADADALEKAGKTFDSSLHPKGCDGRFIETGGGRVALVNKTPATVGIEPYTPKNTRDEKKIMRELNPLFDAIEKEIGRGLFCPALSKRVTGINRNHIIKKHGRLRDLKDLINHTAYLPFAVDVIKNGISDKSLDRTRKGTLYHEVVKKAEITENGAKKRIGVSVIVAEENGGLRIKMISVFRITDKYNVIKSHGCACTR